MQEIVMRRRRRTPTLLLVARRFLGAFVGHYRIARRYCGVGRSLWIAGAFTRQLWRS